MKYFSRIAPVPRTPSKYEILAESIAKHEGWNIMQQDFINIFNEHETVVNFNLYNDDLTSRDNYSWKMHDHLGTYGFIADKFEEAESAFKRMCEDYLDGLRAETGRDMSLQELELKLAIVGV